MKYTHKALCADLLALNAKLEKAGHDLRLVGGRRYGYSAVDLATEDEAKRHCCQRMLYGGTPRECLAKAQAYVLQEVSPKHHDERSEIEANARLIAAAPELLEALAGCADALREAGKDFAQANKLAARPNLYELHERNARAAIAKAKGGAA